MQQLFTFLDQRKISAGRIYSLALTLIKSLNFIADFCITNQLPVSATALPTWPLVTNACRGYKSNEKRHVIAKRVIGPPAAKTLTRADLTILLKECETYLKEQQIPARITKKQRKQYLGHLITALFVSVPPPRVQVLQKLVINKTFFFDDSVYYFLFDGLDPPLKSKKPLVLIVPQHLTAAIRVWLERYHASLNVKALSFQMIRGRALGGTGVPSQPQSHGNI
jgi:hypothetical protein